MKNKNDDIILKDISGFNDKNELIYKEYETYNFELVLIENIELIKLIELYFKTKDQSIFQKVSKNFTDDEINKFFKIIKNS